MAALRCDDVTRQDNQLDNMHRPMQFCQIAAGRLGSEMAALPCDDVTTREDQLDLKETCMDDVKNKELIIWSEGKCRADWS